MHVLMQAMQTGYGQLYTSKSAFVDQSCCCISLAVQVCVYLMRYHVV